MVNRTSILLGAILSCNALSGYIYELKIMRSWDPALKAHKYFIGCSDFHDKTSEATRQQVVHLDTALAAFDKESVEVLLEDLSSPGTDGRVGCGRFCVNSRGGVLGGLTKKCCSLGIKRVTNLEYRYCRVAAIGPVLNNLHQKPHMFPSVATTSMNALSTEIDVVMQEVQAYNDGDVLQKSYRQAIDQVQDHLQDMTAATCKDMSVADYIEHRSTSENRLELVKHLLTFDSCLLDVKMAHAVVHAKVPKIMAIAGGAHITRVTEMLEKVGFQTVYATDVEFHNEHDLTKCLGSTVIDGAYCVRPEPIDLTILHQYIN